MSKITYTVEVDRYGDKSWYLDGKLHREDGPAIECADGSKLWCLDGKRHREDGPAAEYADGSKFWCLNDKLHREDGPAIERADGSKAWWIDGERVTEEEHKRRTTKTINTASLEQALLDAWDAGLRYAYYSIDGYTATSAGQARKEYLEKAFGRVVKSLEKGEDHE